MDQPEGETRFKAEPPESVIGFLEKTQSQLIRGSAFFVLGLGFVRDTASRFSINFALKIDALAVGAVFQSHMP